MVSDSHLTVMPSAPSVFKKFLMCYERHTAKAACAEIFFCVNMKQGNGIVTALQRELIFSILFYPEAMTFLLSASLKGRSTTMSCLCLLVYGLCVAQSSARNLMPFYCLVLHSACDVLIIRV